MKPFIAVIILAVLITTAGLVSYNHIEVTSARLSESLNVMEKTVDKEKWDESLDQLKKLEAEWQKTKKLWAMLIDHIEIDNINISMSELEASLKQKEKSDALTALSTLRILVLHIPEKEAFNLGNIL